METNSKLRAQRICLSDVDTVPEVDSTDFAENKDIMIIPLQTEITTQGSVAFEHI